MSSVEVPCRPPWAKWRMATEMICSRRSAAVSRCRPSLTVLFAPDLDRDLLDGEGDRRLGFGGLDGDGVGAVLGREPVRDHRAQALQRPVRALLGDERDLVADLAVVDGVLDAVGDQRVHLADVE